MAYSAHVKQPKKGGRLDDAARYRFSTCTHTSASLVVFAAKEEGRRSAPLQQIVHLKARAH